VLGLPPGPPCAERGVLLPRGVAQSTAPDDFSPPPPSFRLPTKRGREAGGLAGAEAVRSIAGAAAGCVMSCECDKERTLETGSLTCIDQLRRKTDDMCKANGQQPQAGPSQRNEIRVSAAQHNERQTVLQLTAKSESYAAHGCAAKPCGSCSAAANSAGSEPSATSSVPSVGAAVPS